MQSGDGDGEGMGGYGEAYLRDPSVAMFTAIVRHARKGENVDAREVKKDVCW